MHYHPCKLIDRSNLLHIGEQWIVKVILFFCGMPNQNSFVSECTLNPLLVTKPNCTPVTVIVISLPLWLYSTALSAIYGTHICIMHRHPCREDDFLLFSLIGDNGCQLNGIVHE